MHCARVHHFRWRELNPNRATLSAVELARNLEPADAPDRRMSRRVRVTSGAVLETLTGTFTGRLWDLSEGGARLHLSYLPQIGTNARLCWAEHEALCSVVWSDGEMCGVSFDKPIMPSIVTATAEVHRVLELPIAKVSNIAAGRRRSMPGRPVRLAAAEREAPKGLVVRFPKDCRGGAMSAAQEMFFLGSPLAHVAVFEGRSASCAQPLQKPLG
jgi:hypothetical protein